MFSLSQFSLEGKVAVVTGAGARKNSIGEAYALGLMNAGAAVVVADLNKEGAETVAHGLSQRGGKAIGVKVDIADPASAEALMAAAKQAFGGVDILVNNAAIMVEMMRAPLLDVPIEEWRRMLDVNLLGAVNCARAAVPLMRARGGGRIVNQSSAGAFQASSIYAITKIAVIGLTVAMAKQLGPDKITVNAIAPGMTASAAGVELTGAADNPLRTLLTRICPIHAEGQPDELVGPLLLLCSEAGSWMTGQCLSVDGGWNMQP